MKATEYRKIDSLLNLIGNPNAPKRNKILEACGINGYNNSIFVSEYTFDSKEKFLTDWERYNNLESFKLDMLEKYGMENKKVASFFKKPFISKYSMGEIECIKIISSFDDIPVELFITVRDNRKEYSGRKGSLYNKTAAHGIKMITITVKNCRAKYALEIKDKK